MAITSHMFSRNSSSELTDMRKRLWQALKNNQPPAKLLIQVPVALFHFRQEDRALFGRASLAHDAVAGEGSLL